MLLAGLDPANGTCHRVMRRRQFRYALGCRSLLADLAHVRAGLGRGLLRLLAALHELGMLGGDGKLPARALGPLRANALVHRDGIAPLFELRRQRAQQLEPRDRALAARDLLSQRRGLTLGPGEGGLGLL